MLRNLGEWAVTWASVVPVFWDSFIFMLVHPLHIRKPYCNTKTCRFLEGEDGENTAKILQADIMEAVDIASAAKVSLRLAKGPVVD